MTPIQFTPELAYEDLLIFNNKQQMKTVAHALNNFLEVSSIIGTNDSSKISDYVILVKHESMVEVLAAIHLINNSYIIQKLLSNIQTEITYIHLELAKLQHSIEISECIHVIDALEKTKTKWLLKLSLAKEQLDIANNILAIIILLNRHHAKN